MSEINTEPIDSDTKKTTTMILNINEQDGPIYDRINQDLQLDNSSDNTKSIELKTQAQNQ